MPFAVVVVVRSAALWLVSAVLLFLYVQSVFRRSPRSGPGALMRYDDRTRWWQRALFAFGWGLDVFAVMLFPLAHGLGFLVFPLVFIPMIPASVLVVQRVRRNRRFAREVKHAARKGGGRDTGRP